MILKTIKLHNFMQHRSLEHTFDQNVTAIIGRNGKGKSNFIGAIEFALRGAKSGTPKTELTTWGESNGSVELEVEHFGVPMVIYRETNSTVATFTYNNEEPVKGIKLVAEEIRTKLIDPDLLSQVFVLQAQIDEILFEDPSKRSKAFIKLIGLKDASTIHARLGSAISSLPPVPDHTEMIKHVQENIEICKAIIDEDNKKLEDLDDKISKLSGTKEEIAARKAKYEQWNTIITTQHTNNRAVLEAEAKYKEAFDDPLLPVPECPDIELCNKKVSEAKAVSVVAEDYAKKLADYTSREEWYTKSAATAKEDLEAAKKARDEAEPFDKEKAETELESLSTKSKELFEQMSKVSLDLDPVEKLKDSIDHAHSLGVSGICPTCGQEVSSISDEQCDYITKTKELIKSLHTEYNSVCGDMRLLSDYIKRSTEAGTALHARVKKIEDDLAHIESYRVPSPVKPLVLGEEPQVYIDAYNKAMEDLTAAVHAKKHYDYVSGVNADKIGRQTRLKALWDEAKDRVSANMDPTAPPEVLDAIVNNRDFVAEVMEATRELNEYQLYEVSKTHITNELNQAIATVESETTRLGNLQKIMDNADAYKLEVNTLTRVRHWFHHDNGPGAVITTILDRLTPTVNYFLDKLDAPFSVEADKEILGFRYNMTDGKSRPDVAPLASSLSGAQKNMLALSFRLACYSMFSSRLGVLILDEPTAHLDSHNVGKFGELLHKLQSLAAEMGFQLIVVTHHDAILPFCNQVITIG